MSCHAINGRKPGMNHTKKFQMNWIHDPPTPDAFRHLEEYDFQVMLWEDDIWYLELVLYPPSTDDAYKIITTTIANSTTRWQMMRHWNVLNPGDHDYGMDDVKGPEQIAVRNRSDLGQDPEYMRRNFQIVQHLVLGDEDPSPTANPKRWRQWKMPNRDFTLLVMDSRLWRSSQETRIWVHEGWGGKENVYDRSDPTRALLGEEQFAWLAETIRTDPAPLICLTGINGLHTIWEDSVLDQRNRVAADFAGWVRAGSDRVIELLGSRRGIVTVYGDVHNGMILKNREHRLYECSFGPIGRTGGRKPKPGFGRRMKDYDGRDLEVIALYHQDYQSPDLQRQSHPGYWNFMEMSFHPGAADPTFEFKVRNLADSPSEPTRGGGSVATQASGTGRRPTCFIPKLTTLPQADVWFSHVDGPPIQAIRSLADGTVPLAGFADVAPKTRILMKSFDGTRADIQVFETMEVNA